MKLTRLVGLLLALAMVAAACGGGDDDGATGGDAACGSVGDLDLKVDGKLTVATGEPVFPPWMIEDDPTNQQGFESAIVYAVAEQMGFGADDVDWVRTGFDEAIAPGPKDYDFNIQQFSITPEREEIVDFSEGYYIAEQAVITAADSPFNGATSVADLKDAVLGAAIGTISLDYIEGVIDPTTAPPVFNDSSAATAAYEAGQIDGLVVDLPTAFFLVAVQFEDAAIIGVLPRVGGGEPEQLGMLFEDGSGLVECVNEALRTLHGNGAIEAIEDEWLTDGGDIPSLSE
ncbi:MAG TPA: amino acid ABC transporter substrate-binding protein, partial [Actinobacteria bacterium]|nr:amino acid ABC transporter substrate-binding protein [Actinomycetota bacterium]